MKKPPGEPSSVTINPKDFIQPPFGACPSCGGTKYGVLMINDRSVTRRCRACWHTESDSLPGLQKKVIYLDQMAVSNMTKALDPDRQGTDDGVGPFWRELFEKLDVLVKLQWVACPSSIIHERESQMALDFELYRRMYKHLSAGVSFQHHLMVYQTQLFQALDAWLEGDPPDFSELDRHRAFTSGRLDTWLDRLSIEVHFPTRPSDVEEHRGQRAARRQKLAEYMDAVRQSDGKGFEDWYQEARGAMSEVIVESYLQWLMAVEQMLAGETPPGEAFRNQTIQSTFFPGILRTLERNGVSEDRSWERALEFLGSDAAMSAPYNEIYSLLMAALARKAASGQKKVGRGTMNDIDILSMVLPYVDAVFTDDQFAGLMQEAPLPDRLPSQAGVFSNRTRDDFMDFLEDLRQEVPQEHEELVQDVYGDRWLQPYVGVIAGEKERD